MVDDNDEDLRVFAEAQTATGRTLGIVNSETHGLFVVRYVDGKGGALPAELQNNRYTGVRWALEALNRFVAETYKAAESANTTKRKVQQPAAANV